MFKRKTIASILGIAMFAAGFTGCGSENKISSNNYDAAEGKNASSDTTGSYSVVCTIFPEYDWVREIIGDKAENVELSYLLDSGVDLHSYQPTTDDIIKISTCDLFIYVGGESDEWAEDSLSQATNKNMKVINLLDILGDSAKVEELKEGMQESEHEHEDDEEHEHEHEHEENGVEYDEHVWLSVKNAKVLCAEIERRVEEIDPANADAYKSNYDEYIKKLNALDSDFEKLFANATEKTLVFGDRFPFRYFVDDYGLDYFAAFIGCSAESEASFETIKFLSDKVNELDCKTVFTLENSNKDIANSIITNSGKKDVKIAELNSLQSVSKGDINSGASYISLIRKNYDVLEGSLK